ncbi:MAG: glycosyltransferase family 4 protein [Clostridia bacterium]|nr:glycosyltransferase family 4 protein [Clostridia bacterium]
MKICLTGNSFRPMRPSGLITGFAVATADLMRSFLRHSTAEEIVCLCEPESLQQEVLDKLIRESGQRRCRLVNEYELFFGAPLLPTDVDVFHSVKEDAVPLLALRERLNPGAPMTFTLHCLAEQQMLSDLFLPLVLLPFRRYDAVICTSEAVRKSVDSILTQLEECWQRPGRESLRRRIRLERVPLGVDTQLFRPLDRAALRAKYNIPQNAFMILWFGRFSDLFKADLMPLLHVFAQLVKDNPGKDLRLLLAGCEDGPRAYSRRLQQECARLGLEKHVRIVYNQDIPDRTELYCLSDVFTSPVDNIQETFGLTPVEAMACGVPQVVTDWDGYRDTVMDGETGFLLPTAWCDCLDEIAQESYMPGDGYRRRDLHRLLSARSVAVDCIAYRQRLQQLIDDPALRARMRESSRRRAEEHYDLHSTVRQTEALWQELRAIAAHPDPDVPPMRLPPLDYCRSFHAYPTRWLTDETLFTLTEHGLHGQLPVKDNEAFMARYVPELQLPERLLAHLRCQGAVTMQELFDAFPSVPKSQLRRTVMFLYKYDILRPQV